MIYFAYGANLSRAHIHLWCPGSQPLAPAALSDHRLAFRFWADIVSSQGDRVAGALYEVSAEDIVSLDEYQDSPELYRRIHVAVQSEGKTVEALTYQMRPGYAFAPPAPDYLNIIRQGYDDWGLEPDLLPIKM